MVIAPVVPIVYDAWQGRVDLDVSDRSKRGWYFLWALMCYATAYAAYYVGECHVMAVLSAAYFTVTLGVMLATLRYKVSVHAAGAAGPSTALVYMYGWTAAPVVLVWGAIVWSRVKLRQHTARQGMVGLFLGAAITALTYLWLFQ
ncbi:MAG: hypothetical protein HXY34_03325 [Candidatus Thorarchaeota archaeon]|nr:hypothetical protein [Candidatus Thorarchaeota archaeon]